MPNHRVYRRKDLSTKGRDIWWAVYYADGKRIRCSTGLTDRRAAEEWLKQREREAVDLSPVSKKALLSEALTKIVQSHGIGDNTKRMYVQRGAQIMETLGDVNLFELTRDDVHRHIGMRLGKKISRSTVHKEIITIKRCLEIVGAPVDCTRKLEFKFVYKPRSRWLTFNEYIALTLRLPDRKKIWVTLACYTGGRRSEVDSMLCEDVDFERNSIRIRGTKTADSDRIIPMHNTLRTILLFDNVHNRKGPIVGLWQRVNADLKAACERANIAPASPNDLRRTFCSWMMQAGLSANVVRRLMGHTSTKMIDLVYGQFDWKTLEGAVALLPSKREEDAERE